MIPRKMTKKMDRPHRDSRRRSNVHWMTIPILVTPIADRPDSRRTYVSIADTTSTLSLFLVDMSVLAIIRYEFTIRSCQIGQSFLST